VMADGGGRPRRRDAQRNRDLLTAAARTAFAEAGLDVPLDEIARRAGVGNATLYRHFPDRGALAEAVFHDMLTERLAAGEEARRGTDPWAALVAYLEGTFDVLAADRGANDLMTTAIPGVPSLAALHAHNRETVRLLTERAQRQGTMRADVTAEDLLFTLAALGRAVPALTAVAPDGWRRLLALLLDGLRADTAPRLPGKALSEGQLTAALHELGPHRAR
jgi:AcrR family transcriptional regulator